MARATLYAPVGLPLPQESYASETHGMKSTFNTCTSASDMFAEGEVYRALRQVTDPIVRPTAHSIVDYDSPMAANLRQERRVKPLYFGGMVSTTDPVPGARQVVTKSWRERPKSKMKDWKRRRDKGDIVFRPIKVGKYTAVSNPSLDPRYLLPGSTVATYGRMMDSFLPLDTGYCATMAGIKRMAMGDERCRSTATCNVRVRLQKLSYSDTKWIHLHEMYPGLLDAVDEFVDRISPQYEVNFDRGLSTAVLCEANAGAWDIATEVAEAMRETIPSIVRACAAIITKYLEVRKKIKRLRSNSISEGSLKADIASLWLNFRYGIGPLAYSIQDSLAYFEQQLATYQSYRDGQTHDYEFSHAEVRGTVKVTHRCVVRDLFDPALLGRYDTRGLKINLYDTAWQLMPASFIVDWALNVGDVLTTLVSPDGLKDRKWMYSVRCSDSLVLTSDALPGASLVVDIDCYTASTQVREPVGLQFNPSMTPKRWLDALAIFWGGVKKPLYYR